MLEELKKFAYETNGGLIKNLEEGNEVLRTRKERDILVEHSRIFNNHLISGELDVEEIIVWLDILKHLISKEELIIMAVVLLKNMTKEVLW